MLPIYILEDFKDPQAIYITRPPVVQGPPRPQGTPLYSLAYGVAGGIILSGLVYVRGLGGHQLGEEPSS